jgi:prepilin-type N-terminal cleavage/methylation domain-containing protein
MTGRRGFTLLEVLLAAALLGICTATLLVARGRATLGEARAMQRLRAVAIAQDRLGALQAGDRDAAGGVDGLDGWSWSAEVPVELGRTRSGHRLMRLGVTVRMPAGSGSDELTLRTCRLVPPEDD